VADGAGDGEGDDAGASRAPLAATATMTTKPIAAATEARMARRRRSGVIASPWDRTSPPATTP
jgi:hypothetical protein